MMICTAQILLNGFARTLLGILILEAQCQLMIVLRLGLIKNLNRVGVIEMQKMPNKAKHFRYARTHFVRPCLQRYV